MVIKDFSSSDLDTFENEQVEGMKSVKYNGPEGQVYKLELTYDECLTQEDKIS